MNALKRAGPGLEFVMNVPLICSQPRGLQEGIRAHQYLQPGVTTSGAPKLVGAGGEMDFVGMIRDRVLYLTM